MAVVREHLDLADTGGHGCHLGELLAFEADCDRADGMDVDEADFLAASPHVIGDDHGIGNRAGVRHCEHCGVPTQSSCSRACFDGLRVFATGFT